MELKGLYAKISILNDNLYGRVLKVTGISSDGVIVEFGEENYSYLQKHCTPILNGKLTTWDKIDEEKIPYFRE